MYREFIQKLTNLVDANLANEKYGPKELAREAGMSHSSLNRKLRSILDQNSGQFIREIRLKKAKELLQNENLTVAEISFSVGFGSPSYFIKSFHKYFGYSPGELKNNKKESEPAEKPVEYITGKWKNPKITVVLIIVLIVLIPTTYFLIHRITKSKSSVAYEKSIAILPFADYSPEKGNAYIINGLREEIFNNLKIVEELKTKSSIDANKYKDSKLSIQQIAKELKVNYIITGSGQTVDDNIRFRLQLNEAATGNVIWSKNFETELTGLNSKAIFEIQEEASTTIAYQINKILLTFGLQQESNLSEERMAAKELYMQAYNRMELAGHLCYHQRSLDEIFKVKNLFEQAIKLDSTDGWPYLRLSNIFCDHLYNTPDIILSESYLDSSLFYAKKALHFDNSIEWAKSNIAFYYLKKGKTKEFEDARKEFTKDIDSDKELLEFWMNFHLQDYYKAIECFFKYWENHDIDYYHIHFSTFVNICFTETGYPEISRKYAGKILRESNNSLKYCNDMFNTERLAGNPKGAIDYGLSILNMEEDVSILESMAQIYFYLRDFSAAKKYLQMDNNPYELRNYILPDMMIGYIYFNNGNYKVADSFLKNAEKNCLLEIEYSRLNAQNFNSHFFLACIYATRGENEKAMEYLKVLKKRKTIPLSLVTDLKQSPFLDNIRQEPEFKAVLKDMEAKYQKAHDLVGQLSKEKGFMEGMTPYYLPSK